ncbi:MAG: YCF48-related protein [Ignavibacteria bacterium]
MNIHLYPSGMKYYCISLIVIFILITNTTTSQWMYQKSATTINLYAVCFPNDFTGFVVGDSGLVMKTSNSGLKWSRQFISNSKLNNVKFVDQYTGWVVSDKGEIFKTTSGGDTWETQKTGTTRALYALWFLNSSTGWAAGDTGTFLKTTDGGYRWNVALPFKARKFLAFYFLNPKIGWFTFSDVPGGLAKTADGGESWTIIHNFGHPQYGIYFFNELTGYTCGGSYTLLKTTDGGYNWSSSDSKGESDSPPATYTGISFIDENTGWFTEAHPLGAGVYPVHDGYGESLRIKIYNLYDVCARNSGYAWAVGEYGTIVFRSNSASIDFLSDYNETANRFSLSPNYPNPFNSETKIKFSVPTQKYLQDLPLRISVFDVSGREVDIIANGYFKPGDYELTYNVGKLSSGMYFCKLVSGNFAVTTKMILMK